jgi:hypothetical protein
MFNLEDKESLTTTESSYTGPGVLPAEDPVVRNRIIISVVSSVVAISIIVALLIAWFRRRAKLRVPGDDTSLHGIYPDVKPDIITATPEMISRNVDPPKPARTKADDSKTDLEFPDGSMSDADKAVQDQRRNSFRHQQLSFKHQREASRRSIPRSPTRSPPSGGVDPEFARPDALTADERAVLKVLGENYLADYQRRQSVFKDLLMRWHPDKHSSNKELATSTFQFLQSKKAWFLTDSQLGTT